VQRERRQAIQAFPVHGRVPVGDLESGFQDELPIARRAHPVLVDEAGVVFRELRFRESKEVDPRDRVVRMGEVIRGIDQVGHEPAGAQYAERLPEDSPEFRLRHVLEDRVRVDEVQAPGGVKRGRRIGGRLVADPGGAKDLAAACAVLDQRAQPPRCANIRALRHLPLAHRGALGAEIPSRPVALALIWFCMILGDRTTAGRSEPCAE
jgi:hypothetical protein